LVTSPPPRPSSGPTTVASGDPTNCSSGRSWRGEFAEEGLGTVPLDQFERARGFERASHGFGGDLTVGDPEGEGAPARSAGKDQGYGDEE
jgi:hypothetical protein